MSNSSSIGGKPPHILFFPNPGMGNMNTFLRLAGMLASRKCMITLILAQPINCPVESTQISNFFSNHQNVNRVEFQMVQCDTTKFADYHFIAQFEAMTRSLHLLHPLLSSLPQPITAIFSGFAAAASLAPIAAEHGIPNYIISVTSARCYSTMAYLPTLLSESPEKFSGSSSNIEIPGLAPLPKSIIPPSWLDHLPFHHLATAYMIPNAQALPEAKGIILNSFDWLESETIAALNGNRVISNLPPIFPVGPFEPFEHEKGLRLPWLDEQAANSVAYINFGNRRIMSKDQIRELGNGLERSGVAFLWVIKANKVDEDENEEIRDVLGNSFLERTKNKGIVMKGWVNQEAILAHPAIRGFVTQCDWDSAMEAARQGVPVLLWPQSWVQRINAEVAENAGLGVWIKAWGLGFETEVKGEDFGDRVKEFMEKKSLLIKAKKVQEKAAKARQIDGNSEKVLTALIEFLLKQNCHKFTGALIKNY